MAYENDDLESDVPAEKPRWNVYTTMLLLSLLALILGCILLYLNLDAHEHLNPREAPIPPQTTSMSQPATGIEALAQAVEVEFLRRPNC